MQNTFNIFHSHEVIMTLQVFFMFSFRSKNCSGWVGGLGIRGPAAVYVEIQFNISRMADGVDGRYSCQTKPSLLQLNGENFNTLHCIALYNDHEDC